MTFTQILPFACFAALPLLAGALWLLRRVCRPASGTEHILFSAAGLLAALPVLLWMARGNFPGNVPVAMLYLTLLTLVEAWFLSAESAVRS